ncbi:3-hydroxyisobutyryl-CoA hydrolase, mitochondrial-like [Cydia pomonella]|uniref:3-hydroxyisobutyryl-CoA hydrolase, mitochondrial-like n=1 Tax=Cydia pomonella TaxID=82600 RepID=UPI002ADE4E19|nr:3-hydroxyisobutyryl-CoA hydrolase, mitochondrial-like [Cydia pomonella]
MSVAILAKRSTYFGKSLIATVIRKIGLFPQCPQPVLFETVESAGVVTLNRPKQLNAMDYLMWRQLLPRLQITERGRSRLILKGEGAFSVGKDIKWFFNHERHSKKLASVTLMFNGVYLLSKYKIPSVALINGLTFGAGLMLSRNCKYRVATEHATIGSPEVNSWINNVSGTYHLSRLSNHLGFYLSMTNERLKGKDVVLSGLATHFVPSARLQELGNELCSCKPEDIEARLNVYSEPLGEFSLAPVVKDINHCFSADTVEGIIERLWTVNDPWSMQAVESIAKLSPTMLKVTLRALQLGKASDMKECLQTEYRVLSRYLGSYDAHEGLRAVLMQRSDRPTWRPDTLAEVSDTMVNSYFEPLPEELVYYDEIISK